MSKSPKSESTPVDDVRHVREQLSREAGGDIHRLVRRSQETLEQYREKLGFKIRPALGSPAAILKAMRSPPHISREDTDALERAIEEGKNAAHRRWNFQ